MSPRRKKPRIASAAVDVGRIEALLLSLRAGAALDAAELSLVADIVEGWAHLSERAQRFDLSLADLRKILGILGCPRTGSGDGGDTNAGRTENCDADSAPGLPSAADSKTDDDDASNGFDAQPKGDKGKPQRDNHGRRGAAALPDLIHEQHRHHDLTLGCPCPSCERGRLYRFFPRTFVTISGQAPFAGHRHEVERLQCNVCGDVFEAALPDKLVADGVGNGKLYSYSAHSTVVMLKYLGVMPWHRQQTLQAAMGIMVPDACMWDMCETLSSVVRPVVCAIQGLAAASPLLYGDDTTARIFDLTAEIKTNRKTGKDTERTGCHTTAVIAQLTGGQRVAVFRVGIQHSGELMDQILANRPPGLPVPIVVGDASSSNNVTVCAVHMCGCNAHALRRFKALEDNHPNELRDILAAYRAVYKHDEYTKAQQMDDAQRLAYHRAHSRPVFNKMCLDAQALFDERKVEPNSSLGADLNYLLNHQRSLSAFHRLPGAPIDSRVESRRGGVQAALGCIRRFRHRARLERSHHSVSDSRHFKPDRRVSRIRLTAKASSHRGYVSAQLSAGFRT
jgi:hypothetical protein